MTEMAITNPVHLWLLTRAFAERYQLGLLHAILSDLHDHMEVRNSNVATSRAVEGGVHVNDDLTAVQWSACRTAMTFSTTKTKIGVVPPLVREAREGKAKLIGNFKV